MLRVVRDAFSTEGGDGHEEVEIVKATWALGAAPAGLELVALRGGEIVGHVLGAVGDVAGQAAIGVAPLGVVPAHHRTGVGSALMRELISRANAAGWPLLLLLGDEAYYRRFGFEMSDAIFYGPVGPQNPHFQIRRLSSYTPGLAGEFVYCWER